MQFSPLEFLATLTLPLPDKWEQTTRCYGCYAARARGKKRQVEETANQDQSLAIPMPPFPDDQEPKTNPSKTWAACMKRTFEVAPLVCPKCGKQMKITCGEPVELWHAPPKFNSQKASTNSVVEPFFDGWQSSDSNTSVKH